MSELGDEIGRRAFVTSGLFATGGIVVASGVAADAADAAEKGEEVHITWEADVLEGGLDAFKPVAEEWEAIAAKDPNTLYSKWVIAEDSNAVKLYCLFVDGESAQAQFPVNKWHLLDALIADGKIDATGMVISGAPSEFMEFLREFGAKFMVPVVD
jgi:hypothetical protein